MRSGEKGKKTKGSETVKKRFSATNYSDDSFHTVWFLNPIFKFNNWVVNSLLIKDFLYGT